MNKKLIAINIVLILLISIFSNAVLAATGVDGVQAVPGQISRPSSDGTSVASINPTLYLMIDGENYDASTEASGTGWAYDGHGILLLKNYIGGSIYANFDLWIRVSSDATGESIITAQEEYGIYVEGNLSVNAHVQELIVNGADGFQAIYATGDLFLSNGITAIGGNCSAIYANFFSIGDYEVSHVGNDLNSLKCKEYAGEKCLKIVQFQYPYEYDVILDGNGEATKNGNTQNKICLTITTPTALKLNNYKSDFSNSEKNLLGWFDSKGEFLKLNYLKIKPYENSETLYAHWEDDVNKVVILNNCYTDYKSNRLYGETLTYPVKVGEKFVLPEMTRKGYVLDGWLLNGVLYKAGKEIDINKNMTFTAKYIYTLPEVKKYLIIDGNRYDATSNLSGSGWKYYANREEGSLILNGYNGGSIYANFDLNIGIKYDKESTINADIGRGIYVDGNLSFTSYINQDGSKCSKLTVSGCGNYEAIYATQELKMAIDIEATGDNCRAIYGESIVMPKDSAVFAGNDKDDAVIGEYNNNPYINVTRKHYEFSLTFDANGGRTLDGKTEHNIIFETSTPANLELFDYNELFKNGDKKFIGWQNSEGDFCKYGKYRFGAHDFEETLYALWEDENQKAVYLNNYYMDYNYEEHVELNGGTVIEPVKINEDFVLPNITRIGYILDGWLSSDGTLYMQGDTIKITETISLTAKWSINKDVLVIDGKEYNANEICRGIGWDYHPNLNYTSQRPHIEAQLTIHENYSGLPIVIPKNVYIGINGNVKADELNPAITVYGDVDISLFNHAYETLNDILLRGCGEQPAIKADGAVYLGGIHDSNDSFAIHGGNAGTPAIIASKVGFYDKFFYIGTSPDNLTVASSYTNEHILKLVPNGNIYSIMVSKGDIVPTPPQHNDYVFFGWKVTNGLEFVHPNDTSKWYMPGDVVDIDSNNIILQAAYLDNNRTSVAIALNGNGGVTAEGSKYYITLASTARLSLYGIPEKSFTKDGYSFTGFNTVSAGSGTSYTYGDNLNDDGETFVYNLYAQWKKNETSSNPPSGDGGGGGTSTSSKVTEDGTLFIVTPINVKNGKTVILALYNDGIFVELQKATFDGNEISFTTDKAYTNAKIMAWESLESMKPICGTEEISNVK